MADIQIFNNPEFGIVRTLEEDNGVVLFCASDVAKALGYARPKDAVAAHCKGAVKRVVMHALGGKDAPAYLDKSTRDKVYSECNRDIQNWFRVNSRNNIPRKRFDEAVEYIQRWKPSTNTVMMIQQANEQISLFDRRAAV